MGEWQAFCSGCRQRSVGDLAHAEFWKDQHLADTLVPPGPVIVEKQLIGGREGSEWFVAKDSEGRPSGSKAAAPQAVEAPEVWTESPDDADYTATYETQLVPATVAEDAASAAGSAATHEDPPVQSPDFQVGDEVRWCWTGKNADGTWFNARLTEKHPHHYPKGWAGEVTDCGTAYTAEHMGEVPLGFKLFMDIPSLTLVSRPSPSLRKEGEDS